MSESIVAPKIMYKSELWVLNTIERRKLEVFEKGIKSSGDAEN